MSEKQITIEIKHPELIILLLFSAFILFLELQTTFKSPIAFGDEGFHTRFAQYIAKNKEFPIFTILEETKLSYGGFVRPPLFNILEASLFFVFGTGNDVPIKFLTPFIAVLGGITVFILTKKLYNEKIGFITGILTITIPSFVTYSVMFYSDVLYTFYITLFFFLFLLGIKKNNRKYLLLSGIFGGLAFLTDLSGLAIYIFILLAFLYEVITTRTFLKQFKKYLILALIIFVVSGSFLLRNVYYFKHPICRSFGVKFIDKLFDLSKCSVNKFKPKYQFAGRVEEIGTEQSVYKMGIINYLTFAYGNLWLVTLGFFGGLILLLTKRNKITCLLMIYFAIFLGLFYISTSRAEDTPRNTLGWVPVIALVSATYFGKLYDFVRKYQKYIGIIIFILIIWFSYGNFKEKLDVMFKVKQFSPLFFEACDWIKANTAKNSTLYTVWSHRAVYNCQRNAVGTSRIPDIALSRDINYTIKVAKQNEITHIFLQKFSIDAQNRHLAERYDIDFVQFLENRPGYFNKIYENGPPLQQCIQMGGCDGNIVYEINTTGVN
jgi:4-amino-4-deoxy-L-arabinose transferase-like glycosyltransferase